ncbi:hypothetical protein IJG04_01300 [Candidatus Saccharibacteria bacterium]|nr:hypothetical protein [Candidatus Saccharibacteria bacterium]
MDEGLAKIRHSRSKKNFPFLKLEDGEYVEFVFSRAKTYLLMLLGGLAIGVAVVLFVFLMVLIEQPVLDEMGMNFLFIILATLIGVAVITALVTLRIYNGNKLFITNQHAIQMIMTSPMASSMNIIDLASIEDASFSQDGVLEKMFHFGTFRLATVGDETTYTFKYSYVSPDDLRTISELLTKAKKEMRKKED